MSKVVKGQNSETMKRAIKESKITKIQKSKTAVEKKEITADEDEFTDTKDAQQAVQILEAGDTDDVESAESDIEMVKVRLLQTGVQWTREHQ
jgi:hypothetical protein